MKVRLEAKLTAQDGERVLVRVVDMPAPPSVGLFVVGRGYEVLVERVSFAPENSEYRADGKVAGAVRANLADALRALEIEGWRVTAA